MVHLAPMGYVYDVTPNRVGQLNAVGGYRAPTTTLCGLDTSKLLREPVKVVLPHDHSGACRECLTGLASKQTDQVQPLLF
jgi:hypothetical protein